MKKKNRYIILLLTLCFIGCSNTIVVKTGSDEGILRRRITEYWNVRLNQAYDKSYEFEDPLFRKGHSINDYVKQFFAGTLKYERVDIEDIKFYNADVAIVRMKALVKISLPIVKGNSEKEMTMEEKWVKFEGVWLHDFYNKGFLEK